MILTGFVLSLLCFVGIGALAVLRRRKNQYDYLLSSNDVKPWLVGLSAVATNNSGYMFVGQIGFTYTHGLVSLWLMAGFILGDMLTSFIVHKKLRQVTADREELSYAGIISNWYGQNHLWLRRLGGVITLVFVGTYAAAQLSAGGKALHVLLGWPYEAGAVIGAFIVVVYCFSGGIRASIWTDAAQSFVMIAAMLGLLIVSVAELGGVQAFYQGFVDVSPAYTSLFMPETMRLPLGPLLFVLGWFVAGMGIIGQPQVMVRFMAMDNAHSMGRVRAYYYSWYTLFFAVTILVGISARLLLPEVAGFDPELALPTLALELLPAFLVGVILAGLFAATMSTADSQILACTAAITHDFSRKGLTNYTLTKLFTILVAGLALLISLFGSKSVFVLVLIGWSTLASAFGPLLIAYASGARPGQPVALLAMVTGPAVVLLWRHMGWFAYIHDIAPGMAAGGLLLLANHLRSRRKNVA